MTMTIMTTTKKRYILIITVLMMVMSVFVRTSPSLAASDEAPVVDSSVAAVVDVKTGAIVYGKNADANFNPQSLSKLMTALVIADEKEVSDYKDRITKMLGENTPDEANALAKEVGGNESAFYAKMNEKAKALGCKSTNFASAGGGGADDKSKSTAADMAVTVKAFFANEKLADIVSTEKDEEAKKDENKYGVITCGDGEKTGICTAAAGEKNDTFMVAIVVGGASKDSSMADGKALLKYGLANYRTYIVMAKGDSPEKVKIKGGHRSYVKAYAKEDLCVTLPKEGADSLVKTEIEMGKDLKAPVKKDTVVGKLKAVEAGVVTAQVDLVVKSDINQGGPWSKIGISDYMMIGLCAALAVLIVLIVIIKIKKRKKKKKLAALMAKRREEEAMRIAQERAEKKKRDWPY